MNDLINVFGLAIGLALYAMLLAMVVKAPTRVRFDPVPLATALLGVVWNLCSLAVYSLPKLGISEAIRPFSLIGFIALGFLPAVVVHSVVRGRRDEPLDLPRVGIVALAYAASLGAGVLQIVALVGSGPIPSVPAMRLLTWTFVLLVVPLGLTTRRQPGGRRTLWAAALAAFAVSALHLSQFHDVGNAWPVELVGHHASIPLAIAILYQDFPFALADLFLKRALLLIAIVVASFVGISLGGVAHTVAPWQVATVAAGWVLTSLAYPAIRRGVAWFVDAVVLARPDYRTLEAAVGRQLAAHDATEGLLDDLRDTLARALSASDAQWRASIGPGQPLSEPLVEIADGPAVRLTIPTSEAPGYVLSFNRLTGGRRVLSGDLSFLSTVAVMSARRIDGIRLAKERYERAVREQEAAKLASEAELRALRAQVNPHFLFNALTTIGYLIQTAPPRALETLMRLTSLLRGVLRSEGEYTTLGRELDLVEAYLDIERARFEDRLRVAIDVPEALRGWAVPPLVLQPLVENAVKHGIAPARAGGDLTIDASYAETSTGRQLRLRVSDSGEGVVPDVLARRKSQGVGLNSVERRLTCYYGERASLTIRSAPGEGTVAEILLPTTRLAPHLAREVS